MRLYLINPGNPLVSMAQHNRWSKYRVWKPLGLMVLAALTPAKWEVTIVDENLGVPDYTSLTPPDLVGVTAFTSQAPRAYAVAKLFRDMGAPVVMGGIHASMRPEEALGHVDAIVTGEAEAIWPTVLEDAGRGALQKRYVGGLVDLATVPAARHDLLPTGYAFGSIQTTRGCPLSCHFCSVSAFNGRSYRYRPIAAVVDELRKVPEKLVLVVDDNLIGTKREHMERAKELFRAIIAAGIKKKWVCQATINMADDEELMQLARRAGCAGVFVGFEAVSTEGLAELGKRFNILKGTDLRGSVRRIHQHGISVVGSFIMGLDSDTPGIGRRIADAARHYEVDLINPLYLTPLPGTRLWDKMDGEGRMVASHFPEDWRYYTLSFPVARYGKLSWEQLVEEMDNCCQAFYAVPRILPRILSSLRHGRSAIIMLVANLSYRRNYAADLRALRDLDFARGAAWSADTSVAPDAAKVRTDRSRIPAGFLADRVVALVATVAAWLNITSTEPD